MAFVRDNSAADRVKGSRTGVHPRVGGDLILEPDDLLEGIGEFLEVDPTGEPVGWDLGQIEEEDGLHVYVGLSPSTTMRQTHSPVAPTRASHLVNYAITDGPPPPDQTSPLIAKRVRPQAPLVQEMLATRIGYPPSTEISPHWYAWAVIENGRIAQQSPPVPFYLENGQSARVELPTRDMIGGRSKVAILMAEPGTSRPTRPGPMRVQRVVDLRFYALPYYELTGPYNYDGRPVDPTVNETTLPNAPAPRARRIGGDYGARHAHYQAMIVWTDANGETAIGQISDTKTIYRSERYTVRDKDGKITFAAGEGKISVTRPAAPKGATGWKLFLYMVPIDTPADFSAGWRRVEDKFSGLGGQSPFPLSTRTISTAGWSGDEQYYAQNDSIVCVDEAPPTLNTTGVPPAEDQPATPEAFGPARPEADTYWVRVTEVVQGIESLPSQAVRVDIDADEVFSVIFMRSKNLLPNTSYIETDSAGYPLHWVLGKTGGYADVIEGELVLGTSASTAGTTPDATSIPVPVDPTKPHYATLDFGVREPQTGAQAGSVEAVLRQTLSTGATVDTVLAARSLAGDFEEQIEIAAAGGISPALNTQAITAQLIYRITGATKNLQAKIRHSVVKNHKHNNRRPRRRRKPPKPPVRPGKIRIQDPPEPPWAPDANPITPPDRPLSAGTVLQVLDSDVALPAGFTTVTDGGAVLTRDAAAALGGSASGIKIAKSVAGGFGVANLQKTFGPPAGMQERHAIGTFLKNRLAVAPVNGRLRLHPLCIPSDADAFGWFEAANTQEIVELTIDEKPLQSGATSLTLGTATFAPAVAGVKAVRDLTVSTNPTAPGVVTILLDGAKTNVPAGGAQHEFNFTTAALPSTAGYISLTVAGTKRSIKVAPSLTRVQIAQRVANAGWPGYDVTRTGATVYFKARLPGPRSAPVYSAGTTRMSATIRTTAVGSAETAAEFASRIRAANFPGWTTSTGATSNVVKFTAVQAGPKGGLSISANTTGASFTAAQTTAGTIDSAETFAATIAAATYAGWTTSRTGAVVTFTATTSGVRQRSSYRPLSTGAAGTIRTLQQGSDTAVSAHAKHASGEIVSKKIMEGISPTTVFNTDITVSGAGTDRAVLSYWGSFDNAPLELLARFEDVDLTGFPAGSVRVGVSSETNSTATWELHVDEGKVTSHGTSYYRDHNAFGKWLPQVFCYTEPGQPVRNDLFLQNGRAAVLPGLTYTLSMFVRATVDSATPLRPLVVFAHPSGADAAGKVIEIGDVTNSAGLTGTQPWREYSLTFTVPENCYLVTLGSRSIGAATVAVQEAVLSPGNAAKRTGLYQTNGQYIATYDLRTPKARKQLAFWTRKRISLGATVDTPSAASTFTTSYRSTAPMTQDPTQPNTILWSAWTSDPAAVPDKEFVQVRVDLAGNGRETPALRIKSPFAEYLLMFGQKRLSVLLKPDGTELPGGSAFSVLNEWAMLSPEGRRLLPSGRLHDEPSLFPPVGHLPESELVLFSAEAVRLLQERWRDPWIAEIHGLDDITLKLSARPVFKRESVRVEDDPDGGRHSIWKAQLAPCEVTRAVRLPRPG